MVILGQRLMRTIRMQPDHTDTLYSACRVFGSYTVALELNGIKVL